MQIRSFRAISVCYGILCQKCLEKLWYIWDPNWFLCKRYYINIKFSSRFRGGCQEMIMCELFIVYWIQLMLWNRVPKFSSVETGNIETKLLNRKTYVTWILIAWIFLPIIVCHGCRVRTHRAPNSPYRVSASQTVWQTHLDYGANEAAPRGQQSSRSHLSVSCYKVLCRVILSLSSPNTGLHLWKCG